MLVRAGMGGLPMKTIYGQRGFTVMETMIGLSVAMVVAGGAIALFTGQNKQMMQQQTQVTRNTLKQQLDSAIRSYSALRASAVVTGQPSGARNDLLKLCIFPEDLAEAAKDTADCVITA